MSSIVRIGTISSSSTTLIVTSSLLQLTMSNAAIVRTYWLVVSKSSSVSSAIVMLPLLSIANTPSSLPAMISNADLVAGQIGIAGGDRADDGARGRVLAHLKYLAGNDDRRVVVHIDEVDRGRLRAEACCAVADGNFVGGRELAAVVCERDEPGGDVCLGEAGRGRTAHQELAASHVGHSEHQ